MTLTTKKEAAEPYGSDWQKQHFFIVIILKNQISEKCRDAKLCTHETVEIIVYNW